MSDTSPAPKRRLDPLLLPLFAGGAVLVLALGWLLITPRPSAPPLPNLGPLEARLAALEARPGFNAAPLETRITALEARPRAAAPDLAPIAQRLEALEARLAGLEGRPAPSLDVSGLAPRALAETLATRLDRLTERQDAIAARLQAADAEALRRTEDLARSLLIRLEAAEKAEAERIAAAGAALEGRLAGAESALGARMQALEAAQARIAGIEARTNRVQAIAALRARLDAGQALGPALAPFPNPPAALSRFASASPPTEAALRLAFEDAARAARAASEPAREGQSILESASARLAGLITIRRGETIIWGDEAAAALEAARRALEAGDLPGALGRLSPLPPAARTALGAWEADAQALLAARAAIITLAGG
ncbi:MAG: hypothetical protein INF65_18080 [Roseomonas sp.]|nr:hypothetical protein [Roseomonas sp.]MCA3393085.1 hypothetical protein [Roseomonas sp.]MCA3405990.1 hypothetical protein [Roseomonas sp.]